MVFDEEVMMNWQIAEILGWTKTTRQIRTWSYLGDKPFAIPLSYVVYIAPDGVEHLTPPNWLGSWDLTRQLIDLLTEAEKKAFGVKYFEIGMASDGIAESGKSFDEWTRENLCKAWLAVKSQSRD